MQIVITGHLDRAAAAALADACSHLLTDEMSRLDLDLSGVISSTEEGIAAMTLCLQVGRRLADGVGVSVATEEGRQALLASMTAV